MYKKNPCELLMSDWRSSSLPIAAIFPPRILAGRPGQKNSVGVLEDSSCDKEAEESITYTTVDWREFMCNTWHLEPTLRLRSTFSCSLFLAGH